MAKASAHRRRGGRLALGLGAVAVVFALFWAAAGFFDRTATRWYGAPAAKPAVAAVLFSGDMGLRFGMGPYVARALADVGVPVLGVSSSTAFAARRSRGEVDAIVAGQVRDALARTGADRLVVLGQSFGADMLRVGLADLPPDLRPRIAGAVLVVPGVDAYFRADPTGLAYRGRPDVAGAEPGRLDWLPILCIRGATETDSLCPLLDGPRVKQVVLPGGHFLRNDHALLARTILASAPMGRSADAPAYGEPSGGSR